MRQPPKNIYREGHNSKQEVIRRYCSAVDVEGHCHLPSISE